MEIPIHLSVICCCITLSMPANVIVFTLIYGSHVNTHATIAQILADEGHTVDLVIPPNAKIPDVLKAADVNVLPLRIRNSSYDFPTERANKLLDYAMSKTLYQSVVNFVRIMALKDQRLAEMKSSLLNDKEIRNRIVTAHYDVAIVDNLNLNIYASLPFNRNIPVILVGILSLDWAISVPSLPSFVPFSLTNFDDKMSFSQRFLNTLAYALVHIICSSNNDQVQVSVSNLSRRCSMFFVLDDIAINYPRPKMPNIINIGDALVNPSKPLPSDIAEFVESAEHGVILVAFGTFLGNMPPHITDKLCSTFKRIPQKVIWRQTINPLCDASSDNVLILNWLPQNDLLSHSNVKLFISHSGKNSLLESIYHSTPMIGFPFSRDQPYNAKILEAKRLGYAMNFADFSADDLVSKISDILVDQTILYNVRRASFLMRNKTDIPKKRICYWVEYLAMYGDNIFKSGARELSTFQFYCLDVIALLLAIVVLTIIAAFYCLKSTLKFCKRVSVLKTIFFLLSAFLMTEWLTE